MNISTTPPIGEQIYINKINRPWFDQFITIGTMWCLPTLVCRNLDRQIHKLKKISANGSMNREVPSCILVIKI